MVAVLLAMTGMRCKRNYKDSDCPPDTGHHHQHARAKRHAGPGHSGTNAAPGTLDHNQFSLQVDHGVRLEYRVLQPHHRALRMIEIRRISTK